eukprot:gene9989-2164_t
MSRGAAVPVEEDEATCIGLVVGKLIVAVVYAVNLCSGRCYSVEVALEISVTGLLQLKKLYTFQEYVIVIRREWLRTFGKPRSCKAAKFHTRMAILVLNQPAYALLVLAAFAFSTGLSSNVITLTESNFESTLKNRPIVLVEFYAPWCGHCKRLEPEYEKAANELAKTDLDVALAKVDATEEKELATKFDVNGYPTIKLFRYGKVAEPFDGERTAAGLVKYMTKVSTPSVTECNILIFLASHAPLNFGTELKSLSEVDSFLSSNQYSVIAFLKNNKNLRKEFKNTADANRDVFNFASISDPEALEKYGANTVVVFQPKKLQNKFEEPTATFPGKPSEASKDTLTKFIIEFLLGKVGVMTHENAIHFLQRKPLIVVYFDLDLELDPSRVKYIRNRVLKGHSMSSAGLTWAVADKNTFSPDLKAYDITNDIGVAIQGADGRKYRMKDEWSIDGMVQFAEDFASGNLEPYIKSEPIPENDDDSVRTVVGKNFKDIVVEEKDVMIEFYAPWCGHCKKLAPTWSELGDKFADDDNVVIAKLDATANDFPPEFSVRGYPSIFFVPAGSDKPVKYEGGRDLSDMVAYIRKHRKSTPRNASSKDEL